MTQASIVRRRAVQLVHPGVAFKSEMVRYARSHIAAKAKVVAPATQQIRKVSPLGALMRRLATQGPVSYRIAAALQWAEVYVRVGSFNNTMVQNESLNNTMVQLELIRQLAEFNDGMSRVIGKAWNRNVAFEEAPGSRVKAGSFLV